MVTKTINSYTCVLERVIKLRVKIKIFTGNLKSTFTNIYKNNILVLSNTFFKIRHKLIIFDKVLILVCDIGHTMNKIQIYYRKREIFAQSIIVSTKSEITSNEIILLKLI